MPVTFREEDHSYTSHLGEKYISATTLTGKFKNKFDPYAIAWNGKTLIENYVKKYGETEEYWLERWDQNRDEACERGTNFHKAKEDYINGRGVVVFKNEVKFVKNASFVLESTSNLADLEDGLYTELLLWDDAWKLAGQSDIVVITTEGGVRYVDFDDHKTNKKIDTKSYRNKQGDYKMMLSPLSHLMDCHLQHYELQMSIYAYMMERNGYVVRSLQFTHYGHEYFDELLGGMVTPDPVVYKLTYRKKEVLAMLNAHRKDEQQKRRKATTTK